MKALRLVVVCLGLVGLNVLVGVYGIEELSGLVGHAQGPCPMRGSCNVEPALQGRSDLPMYEDFERSTWQSAWTDIDFPTNVSAISYFRCYVRFNDTWQRTTDGKIGKLPGFDAAYGTGPRLHSVERHQWLERADDEFRPRLAESGRVLYLPRRHARELRRAHGLVAHARRNRWYKREAHVRVNTISGERGNNDGVLEGWIDDQLAFRRTNLRFRDVSNLRIESIWGNIYVGGTWVADRDMAIHFDNMVVARSRIGGGGSSNLPSPATGLRIISSGS